MYYTKNVDDLEKIYSILREEYPSKQIEVTYDSNTKEYSINLTKKKFEKDPDVPLDLKVEVVYGDSVTGDSPLLLKKNGTIYIETIQSIFNDSEKFEYPGFKIFDQNIRLEKEYSLSDYQIWTDIGWVDIKKVIRHKCEKKIYRVLTDNGSIDVTEDHSLIRTNFEPIKPKDLKVGDSLLHSFPKEYNCPLNFPNTSDEENMVFNEKNLVFNDKISAQRAYYILKSQNTNVKIENIENQYHLIKTEKSIENKIKKIIDKGVTNDYVYDIETECGRFQAGIGDIIVKNTDSIFLKFRYNRDNFEQNRIDTFKLATICGDNLTNDIFKRPPIELEFEKVFQPFILLTKKRYIGKKFEDTRDPFKLKVIDTKGIALTRRDYCNMVKKCYREIINVMMETGNLEESFEVFKKYINKIDNYDIDVEDLIISAMLAKEYSCGLCKKKTTWVCIRCEKCNTSNSHLNNSCDKCKNEFHCRHQFSLAHVNLGVNLLKRKEEIGVNDRIQYIFVEGTDPRQKKGELAEDPKYAKENNLKFNRSCYLEQLAKTILGFFKITLENNQELLGESINYVNEKLINYNAKPLKPSDFIIE
jgi:hypothetical protein